MGSTGEERLVRIEAGSVLLEGNLSLPEGTRGIVLFAHGSGSSRLSPRNRHVAKLLNQARLATLLVDLLSPEEEAVDLRTAQLRFNIGLLAERVTIDARAHAEQLTPNVLAALGDAGLSVGDLGAVVVGCGPGPFTGLRVGMATAAAYGHALGIPVHGVCSLDAIGIESAGTVSEVLVVTDARRREVYWALYAALRDATAGWG